MVFSSFFNSSKNKRRSASSDTLATPAAISSSSRDEGHLQSDNLSESLRSSDVIALLSFGALSSLEDMPMDPSSPWKVALKKTNNGEDIRQGGNLASPITHFPKNDSRLIHSEASSMKLKATRQTSSSPSSSPVLDKFQLKASTSPHKDKNSASELRDPPKLKKTKILPKNTSRSGSSSPASAEKVVIKVDRAPAAFKAARTTGASSSTSNEDFTLKPDYKKYMKRSKSSGTCSAGVEDPFGLEEETQGGQASSTKRKVVIQEDEALTATKASPPAKSSNTSRPSINNAGATPKTNYRDYMIKSKSSGTCSAGVEDPFGLEEDTADGPASTPRKKTAIQVDQAPTTAKASTPVKYSKSSPASINRAAFKPNYRDFMTKSKSSGTCSAGVDDPFGLEEDTAYGPASTPKRKATIQANQASTNTKTSTLAKYSKSPPTSINRADASSKPNYRDFMIKSKSSGTCSAGVDDPFGLEEDTPGGQAPSAEQNVLIQTDPTPTTIKPSAPATASNSPPASICSADVTLKQNYRDFMLKSKSSGTCSAGVDDPFGLETVATVTPQRTPATNSVGQKPPTFKTTPPPQESSASFPAKDTISDNIQLSRLEEQLLALQQQVQQLSQNGNGKMHHLSASTTSCESCQELKGRLETLQKDWKTQHKTVKKTIEATRIEKEALQSQVEQQNHNVLSVIEELGHATRERLEARDSLLQLQAELQHNRHVIAQLQAQVGNNTGNGTHVGNGRRHSNGLEASLLQKENEALRAQMAQQTAELKAVQQAHTKAIAQLKTEMEASRQSLQDSQQQTKIVLQNQAPERTGKSPALEELSAKLAALTERVQKSEEGKDCLRQELLKEFQAKEHTNGYSKTVGKQADASQEEKEAFQSKIMSEMQAKEKRLEDLEQQMKSRDQSDAKLVQISDKLQQSEEAKESLRKELMELLNAKESRIQDLERRQLAAKQQDGVEETRAKLDELSDAVKEGEVARTGLRDELLEQLQAKETRIQELERIQEASGSTVASLEETNATIDALANRVHTNEEENKSLKTELDETKARATKLEQLEQRRQQNTIAENNDVTKQLEQQMLECQSLRKAVEQAVKDAKESVAKMQEEALAACRKGDDVQASLGKVAKEHSEAISALQVSDAESKEILQQSWEGNSAALGDVYERISEIEETIRRAERARKAAESQHARKAALQEEKIEKLQEAYNKAEEVLAWTQTEKETIKGMVTERNQIIAETTEQLQRAQESLITVTEERDRVLGKLNSTADKCKAAISATEGTKNLLKEDEEQIEQLQSVVARLELEREKFASKLKSAEVDPYETPVNGDSAERRDTFELDVDKMLESMNMPESLDDSTHFLGGAGDQHNRSHARRSSISALEELEADLRNLLHQSEEVLPECEQSADELPGGSVHKKTSAVGSRLMSFFVAQGRKDTAEEEVLSEIRELQ